MCAPGPSSARAGLGGWIASILQRGSSCSSLPRAEVLCHLDMRYTAEHGQRRPKPHRRAESHPGRSETTRRCQCTAGPWSGPPAIASWQSLVCKGGGAELRTGNLAAPRQRTTRSKSCRGARTLATAFCSARTTTALARLMLGRTVLGAALRPKAACSRTGIAHKGSNQFSCTTGAVPFPPWAVSEEKS